MDIAAATTIDSLPSDVFTTQVLRRLDGPTLATVGCVGSRLRTLASDPDLWQGLCLSSWPSLRHPSLLCIVPSFPSSHRSFFSDAYPFPSPTTAAADDDDDQVLLPELISAVHLFHRGQLVFSKVIQTECESPWFLGSPFRVDALEHKDRTPPEQRPSTTTTGISLEDLTLSWIIIDQTNHRAVDLSSRRPVSVDQHWHTGETIVRFATVLGNGVAAATAVLKCSSETTQLTEVALTMDGEDGLCLNGKESLVLLKGLLEGGRNGRAVEDEAGIVEVKQRYWQYESRKKEKKEKMVRTEGRVDMFFALAGIFLFFASVTWMVSP